MSSEDDCAVETTQRPVFNAFAVSPNLGELILTKHFADTSVAETWRAWLQGECVSFEDIDGVRLLPRDWIDDNCQKAITLPSASMALWGLRELLLCKVKMLEPNADRLGESLQRAIESFDEQEAQRAQDLWHRLAEHHPEAFAKETVMELLGGEVVLQGYHVLGHDVWRAALGKETSGEFQTILDDAVEQGFSTLSTARELNITHIAPCTHWSLRMCLRLQRLARESVGLGVDTDDKLQIVLQREEAEIERAYASISAFERRWLQALLF